MACLDKKMDIMESDSCDFSWCYGLVGISIYMKDLEEAKDLLKEMQHYMTNSLAKLITMDFLPINNHQVCLCHGIAGLIYYLWREGYLECSHNILRLLNRYYERLFIEPNQDFRILEGYGGMLLVILALHMNKQFKGDILLGYS